LFTQPIEAQEQVNIQKATKHPPLPSLRRGHI
jgi:hypothetical protein